MDCNDVAITKQFITSLKPFLEPFGGLILTFIAAILAYRYGLKMYFTQREHELISKRYIDDGIGQTINIIRHALSISMNNIIEARSVLGRFFGMGFGCGTIKTKTGHMLKISFDFKRFSIGEIERIHRYKLDHLVGDIILSDIIDDFFVLLAVNSWYLDSIFTADIESIVNLLGGKDGENKSHRDVIREFLRKLEEIEKELNKCNEDLLKYNFVIDYLQKIVWFLEKEKKLTWAKLDDFKNRPEIIHIVKKTKEKYAEIEKTKPDIGNINIEDGFFQAFDDNKKVDN